MDILIISISLDSIYCSSVDRQEPQPVKKWQERIILPKALSVLELFCAEKGIKDFGPFLDICNALPDSSLAIVFTPIEQLWLYLSLAQLH